MGLLPRAGCQRRSPVGAARCAARRALRHGHRQPGGHGVCGGGPGQRRAGGVPGRCGSVGGVRSAEGKPRLGPGPGGSGEFYLCHRGERGAGSAGGGGRVPGDVYDSDTVCAIESIL